MGHGIRNGRRVHEPRPVSLGELIHEHVRRAIEVAVEEELTTALAARRYERSAPRRGYRNGQKARTVTGSTGPLLLTLPRATLFGAAGPREWQSAIVPRYARRAAEVNATVVATYLAGTNTRRIRGALAPLLKGAPLSKSAVSRVVATLREDLQTWMSRSLVDVDGVVVYLDAIALRVRSAGRVVGLPVLAAVGVLPDGRKQLLALECCGSESAAAWRGFVENLAGRGLAAPLLCVIDGHPGLRRAVGELWPTALVQRCCVHKRVSRKGGRVQWEGRPTGVRARRPVAWMAGRRETEALEPIDEAIGRMVSEWPGRNGSERRGSPENASSGGRACACDAKAAGTVAVWLARRLPSGGVRATAR
jgi:transposase-like protein